MDADYDIFEIVAVFRKFWLIDSESYQRSYITKQRQPLASGYYVVNWPDNIRDRRFNENADFHGPFISRNHAQEALVGMQQERLETMVVESKKSVSKPKLSSLIGKEPAIRKLRKSVNINLEAA